MDLSFSIRLKIIKKKIHINSGFFRGREEKTEKGSLQERGRRVVSRKRGPRLTTNHESASTAGYEINTPRGGRG